jgi:DNA-binding transcriptional LysR family regulator
VVSLSSIQLDAFLAIAQYGQFSKAAKSLHVTQSALSQRIANLESELRQSLLVRARGGVLLTDSGTRLLRYCKVRETLERELLSSVTSNVRGQLAGTLTLGGYSSVTRSILFPALSRLLRENPHVFVHYLTREMKGLQDLLRSGAVDAAVIDRPIETAGFETHLLGTELYVLIESRGKESHADVFLDTDSEDSTTELFLNQHGKKLRLTKRMFVADVYGIIDGVALGWGKGVVPMHMLSREWEGKIQVAAGYGVFEVPVYLQYFAQRNHSDLLQAVARELTRACPRLLKRSAGRVAAQ